MPRRRPLWPVSKRLAAARRSYEHANRDVVENPTAYSPLRVARVQAGLTQRQVSEAAGLSREGYIALEQGKRHPRKITADRIASALDRKAVELWGSERDQELYRLAQEGRVIAQ